MQHTSFTIRVDHTRRDLFAVVSQSYIHTHLIPLLGRKLPSVVTLQVSNAETSSHFLYLGCLTERPHNASMYQLQISATLANDLHLHDGQLVECSPLLHVKRAIRVIVTPLTVDESEVVEQNAIRIENELLRQVQVVYVDMPITVSVFAGVHAQVKVSSIECGENNSDAANNKLFTGPAIMFEGTHFVIATQLRATLNDETSNGNEEKIRKPPSWSILRAFPRKQQEKKMSMRQGSEMEKLCIHANTAHQLHWLVSSELSCLRCHVIDLTCLHNISEHKFTHDFMRNHSLELMVEIDNSLCEHVVTVPYSYASQTTNVLVLPSVKADEDHSQENGNGKVEVTNKVNNTQDENLLTTEVLENTEQKENALQQDSVVNDTAHVSFEHVHDVHGHVVEELLDHLSFIFTDALTLHPRRSACSQTSALALQANPTQINYTKESNCNNTAAAVNTDVTNIKPTITCPGNVLVCGGKGYGKSTIITTVLHKLPHIHTKSLICTTSKNFLPLLRDAMIECTLAKPSVLVLHHIDTIAPAQSESGVEAVSAPTRATLEALLGRTNIILPFNPEGAMVIIATCINREAVLEQFRNTFFFARSITVNALDRTSRQTLLRQLFSHLRTRCLHRMAMMMDNYTPFDVVHVSARIMHEVEEQQSEKKQHHYFALLDHKKHNKNSNTEFENNQQEQLKKWERKIIVNTDEKDEEEEESEEEELLIIKSAERCTANFTPLAHTGIKFLKSSSDEQIVWSEIGGLAEAKKVLYDTLVLPMHHRSLFARLPLKTRSGILLYGPSGCGKTYIVEALMSAYKLNCIVVNGPEVFGKYIGQSEQKIRDVFERAQAAAPCVVFFDEFDSVAPQRGVDNTGVTDRVVNQLLCYLDGVESRKDVYVVAASSRPDLIDAALLRPGRLDKAVLCPVPTVQDRVAIMRYLLHKVNVSFDTPSLEHMANQMHNWTPADIAAVVTSANTMVNQRIIDEVINKGKQTGEIIDDGKASNNNNAYIDNNIGSLFHIAGLHSTTTVDKITDTLQHIEEEKSTNKESQTSQQARMMIQMTINDVQHAIASTRPSLSAKDLERQKRIHEIFSRGRTPVPVAPGTKVTFSEEELRNKFE